MHEAQHYLDSIAGSSFNSLAHVRRRKHVLVVQVRARPQCPVTPLLLQSTVLSAKATMQASAHFGTGTTGKEQHAGGMRLTHMPMQ